MKQHGSKYFARRPLPATLSHPPPTLGMGSVGQNSTFSEHGHVAYQTKENHECGYMVAIFCPQTSTHPITPTRPWLV